MNGTFAIQFFLIPFYVFFRPNFLSIKFYSSFSFIGSYRVFSNSNESIIKSLNSNHSFQSNADSIYCEKCFWCLKNDIKFITNKNSFQVVGESTRAVPLSIRNVPSDGTKEGFMIAHTSYDHPLVDQEKYIYHRGPLKTGTLSELIHRFGTQGSPSIMASEALKWIGSLWSVQGDVNIIFFLHSSSDCYTYMKYYLNAATNAQLRIQDTFSVLRDDYHPEPAGIEPAQRFAEREYDIQRPQRRLVGNPQDIFGVFGSPIAVQLSSNFAKVTTPIRVSSQPTRSHEGISSTSTYSPLKRRALFTSEASTAPESIHVGSKMRQEEVTMMALQRPFDPLHSTCTTGFNTQSPQLYHHALFLQAQNVVEASPIRGQSNLHKRSSSLISPTGNEEKRQKTLEHSMSALQQADADTILKSYVQEITRHQPTDLFVPAFFEHMRKEMDHLETFLIPSTVKRLRELNCYPGASESDIVDKLFFFDAPAVEAYFETFMRSLSHLPNLYLCIKSLLSTSHDLQSHTKALNRPHEPILGNVLPTEHLKMLKPEEVKFLRQALILFTIIMKLKRPVQAQLQPIQIFVSLMINFSQCQDRIARLTNKAGLSASGTTTRKLSTRFMDSMPEPEKEIKLHQEKEVGTNVLVIIDNYNITAFSRRPGPGRSRSVNLATVSILVRPAYGQLTRPPLDPHNTAAFYTRHNYGFSTIELNSIEMVNNLFADYLPFKPLFDITAYTFHHCQQREAMLGSSAQFQAFQAVHDYLFIPRSNLISSLFKLLNKCDLSTVMKTMICDDSDGEAVEAVEDGFNYCSCGRTHGPVRSSSFSYRCSIDDIIANAKIASNSLSDEHKRKLRLCDFISLPSELYKTSKFHDMQALNLKFVTKSIDQNGFKEIVDANGILPMTVDCEVSNITDSIKLKALLPLIDLYFNQVALEGGNWKAAGEQAGHLRLLKIFSFPPPWHTVKILLDSITCIPEFYNHFFSKVYSLYQMEKNVQLIRVPVKNPNPNYRIPVSPQFVIPVNFISAPAPAATSNVSIGLFNFVQLCDLLSNFFGNRILRETNGIPETVAFIPLEFDDEYSIENFNDLVANWIQDQHDLWWFLRSFTITASKAHTFLGGHYIIGGSAAIPNQNSPSWTRSKVNEKNKLVGEFMLNYNLLWKKHVSRIHLPDGKAFIGLSFSQADYEIYIQRIHDKKQRSWKQKGAQEKFNCLFGCSHEPLGFYAALDYFEGQSDENGPFYSFSESGFCIADTIELNSPITQSENPNNISASTCTNNGRVYVSETATDLATLPPSRLLIAGSPDGLLYENGSKKAVLEFKSKVPFSGIRASGSNIIGSRFKPEPAIGLPVVYYLQLLIQCQCQNVAEGYLFMSTIDGSYRVFKIETNDALFSLVKQVLKANILERLDPQLHLGHSIHSFEVTEPFQVLNDEQERAVKEFVHAKPQSGSAYTSSTHKDWNETKKWWQANKEKRALPRDQMNNVFVKIGMSIKQALEKISSIQREFTPPFEATSISTSTSALDDPDEVSMGTCSASSVSNEDNNEDNEGSMSPLQSEPLSIQDVSDLSEADFNMEEEEVAVEYDDIATANLTNLARDQRYNQLDQFFSQGSTSNEDKKGKARAYADEMRDHQIVVEGKTVKPCAKLFIPKNATYCEVLEIILNAQEGKVRKRGMSKRKWEEELAKNTDRLLYCFKTLMTAWEEGNLIFNEIKDGYKYYKEKNHITGEQPGEGRWDAIEIIFSEYLSVPWKIVKGMKEQKLDFVIEGYRLAIHLLLSLGTYKPVIQLVSFFHNLAQMVQKPRENLINWWAMNINAINDHWIEFFNSIIRQNLKHKSCLSEEKIQEVSSTAIMISKWMSEAEKILLGSRWSHGNENRDKETNINATSHSEDVQKTITWLAELCENTLSCKTKEPVIDTDLNPQYHINQKEVIKQELTRMSIWQEKVMKTEYKK